MAVFYDTGGGDIYAGPNKRAIVAAMRADGVFEDFSEKDIYEVPGWSKMRASNENDEPTDELVKLEDEYEECLGAYCIASNNC